MTEPFTLYHGHASPTDLQTCRETAPQISHGVEWSDPVRMVDRDEPYVLDNGVYSGDFSPERFWALLDRANECGRDPAFVVLPDVYDDWPATVERHRKWAAHVNGYGFRYYVVAQPRAGVEEILSVVDELDADGVFIGGSSMSWKHAIARRLSGSVPVHIGNPGTGEKLAHAAIVADSADTTTIVQNDYYHHLERIPSAVSIKRGVA